MTLSGEMTERGLVLGFGCRPGAAIADILDLACAVLADAGYPKLPLHAIASLNARATEPAILALAHHFAVPLLTFDAVRLEAETPRIATPSPDVFRLTGCHSVAEASALAVAGLGGRLVVEKRASRQATAAVVEAESKQVLAAMSSTGLVTSSQIESSLPALELAG
ncbi:cobalt-precorrin 5A hydrolase/precorrin-3B C17-methyltransferase [Rhizobium sp. PP-F2F-G38]|nr:cobalt-precorrin 5A hydrolase/precorrin-3B C17-methyltransferase [Rhizobium sp. PP-WC-1G-195]PYF00710.1 cobalt-precorrin 5A hydrolase/precorrin-3B C17-methyltransferase [Rhizobium sp. PP-F2F-G38]